MQAAVATGGLRSAASVSEAGSAWRGFRAAVDRERESDAVADLRAHVAACFLRHSPDDLVGAIDELLDDGDYWALQRRVLRECATDVDALLREFEAPSGPPTELVAAVGPTGRGLLDRIDVLLRAVVSGRLQFHAHLAGASPTQRQVAADARLLADRSPMSFLTDALHPEIIDAMSAGRRADALLIAARALAQSAEAPLLERVLDRCAEELQRHVRLVAALPGVQLDSTVAGVPLSLEALQREYEDVERRHRAM